MGMETNETVSRIRLFALLTEPLNRGFANQTNSSAIRKNACETLNTVRYVFRNGFICIIAECYEKAKR